MPLNGSRIGRSTMQVSLWIEEDDSKKLSRVMHDHMLNRDWHFISIRGKEYTVYVISYGFRYYEKQDKYMVDLNFLLCKDDEYYCEKCKTYGILKGIQENEKMYFTKCEKCKSIWYEYKNEVEYQWSSIKLKQF